MSQTKQTPSKSKNSTTTRKNTNTSARAKQNLPAKTSTSKGNSVKAKNYAKSAPKTEQVPDNTGLRLEIIILALLAFSILLFISNFGLGGAIGKFMSKFLFGMFGLSAYVFPILFFFAATFYLVNKNSRLCFRKMLGMLTVYLCVLIFLHMITVGYSKGESLGGFYRYCSVQKTGGGIIGGGLSHLLCTAFGQLGTYVIVFILILIAGIILTQKPLLAPIKHKSEQVYKEAKEKYQRRNSTATIFNMEQLKLPAPESKHVEPKVEVVKTEVVKADMETGEIIDVEEISESKETLEEPEISTEKKDIKQKVSSFLDFKIHRASLDEIFAEEPEEEERMISDEPTGDDYDFEQYEAENFGPDNSIENSVSKKKQAPTSEVVSEDSTEKPAGTRNVKNPKSSEKEIHDGIEKIQTEIEKNEEEKKEYVFPPISLLKRGKRNDNADSDAQVRETAMKLQTTLHNFGVNVTVTDVSCGPTVTRYELQPEQGVKVSRIVNLADDIKLNLAAADIRIEAPIPGKAAVGIEVPNATNSAVMLRDLLESREFAEFPSELAFAVGKDIAGKTIVADIGKMPHVLIAGATGSGKSVCINTLILSIIYKSSPEDVKMIMVDPKVVELSVYNGIPHLFIPVVTDPKKAAGALNWAVAEMTDRYNKFAEYNVRDLKGYNEKVAQVAHLEGEDKPKKLPKIVIIVDELADLMMVAPGEVEDAICRLAQLARAAGIHLIIATQRPSVNVITGLIKANMPSRIAFSVSSGVDSRTILDMNGAEKLLGKGDMLYYPQGYAKPARLQGSFVSDEEVGQVVEFLTSNHTADEKYDTKIAEMMNSSTSSGGASGGSAADIDSHFVDAGKFIIEKDKASIGMLQRVFKIGFNRAARIMDQLCEAGVVGPEEGTKPRKVLMTMEEFENYIEESL